LLRSDGCVRNAAGRRVGSVLLGVCGMVSVKGRFWVEEGVKDNAVV